MRYNLDQVGLESAMGKHVTIRQIIFAFLFICNISAFAQDAEFSQFYANRLYLNPAFAGSERCPRIGLNYRNQWPPIDGGFITYSASYDQYFKAISGGLGVQIMSDEAGAGRLTKQSASLMYAYRLNITRFFSMSAGAQVTYFERKIDWNKLTFGDMIDPRQGFIYNTNEVPLTDPARNVDFSVGVLGFSEKYFGGVAVHHITQPDESLTESGSVWPRKVTVHAGAIFPIRGLGGVDKGTISPNFIYQTQSKFQLFNYGFYASRGIVVGGLWVRHSTTNFDAVIAMVGIRTDQFKFGYSYDLTVSKYTNKSGGSHEISFVLNLGCKERRVPYKTVNCPTF